MGLTRYFSRTTEALWVYDQLATFLERLRHYGYGINLLFFIFTAKYIGVISIKNSDIVIIIQQTLLTQRSV